PQHHAQQPYFDQDQAQPVPYVPRGNLVMGAPPRQQQVQPSSPPQPMQEEQHGQQAGSPSLHEHDEDPSDLPPERQGQHPPEREGQHPPERQGQHLQGLTLPEIPPFPFPDACQEDHPLDSPLGENKRGPLVSNDDKAQAEEDHLQQTSAKKQKRVLPPFPAMVNTL
ncbi:unnamed protein product, partial [Amoebophrya sp. A25]